MRQRLNDALEVIKPIGWMVLGLGLGAAFVATFSRSGASSPCSAPPA